MALKVGLVGAAWGGMAHLPAWRSIPGVEVTAVCTSREESAREAAERLQIERPYWDPIALCSDPDIDIVDLGTRPNLREPWVIAALENGKHVYNSSPHAPGWEAAKRIEVARQASSSVGIVDAFAQWIPAIRHQIDLVRGGYLGQSMGGTCHFNISLFNTPITGFPYNWFSEKSAGVSAMRNNGSHALYPLLAMFGPVEELVADDRQAIPEWRFDDGSAIIPENTDFGNALLRFANGATIQLQASWNMVQHDGWLLDVFGTEGRLVTSSPTFPTARECTLHGAKRTDKASPHAATDLPTIDIPDEYLKAKRAGIGMDYPMPPCFPMALSMEAMVDAIEGDASEANPDFGRALEVERVQEAIRLSQAERRWVALAKIA